MIKTPKSKNRTITLHIILSFLSKRKQVFLTDVYKRQGNLTHKKGDNRVGYKVSAPNYPFFIPRDEFRWTGV